MTIEEEKTLGKKTLFEIQRQNEILQDLALQSFVDRVSRSLLAHIAPTPFDFHFYVVKDQDPNAFAIPGGYVFVTTGLLTLADSEDELAIIAMLLDDYYQQMLHAPAKPAQPPASGKPPRKPKSGRSRSGRRRRGKGRSSPTGAS